MRNGRLLRLAIDTNVFFSSLLYRNSPPGRVVDFCQRPDVSLVLSGEQRHEIARVVQRPVFNELRTHRPEQLRSLEGLLDAAEQPITANLDINVCDPKDVPILAAAIAGDADYLITGDDDLLSLRDDPRIGGLQIVTPREFLETIAGIDGK